MRSIRHNVIWLIPTVFAAGCLRTVYVPDGDPVRLRAPIRRARVWVREADGTVSAARMDIPEGWYALPDRTESAP